MQVDDAITRWINSAAGSSAPLDQTGIFITNIGIPMLVAMVAAQWWSSVERSHVRHACTAAGLSFLAGLGLNQIIVHLVHRARPYDAGISHLIISRSGDWSFPSDHATAAIAIVTTFVLQRIPFRAALFGALALLICWSRIYVGTHYLADVLGGAFTGLIAAALVRALYREGNWFDRQVTRIW